jgi:hypothetical protein
LAWPTTNQLDITGLRAHSQLAATTQMLLIMYTASVLLYSLDIEHPATGSDAAKDYGSNDAGITAPGLSECSD